MPIQGKRGWCLAGSITLVAILAACENKLDNPKRDPIQTASDLSAQSLVTGDEVRTVQPSRQSLGQAERIRTPRGFVRRGTVVPLTETPLGDSALTQRGGEISLDFQGADLASVIKVILEDGLGASYVLDPQVTGTVTLRTNRPLRATQILPVLEEILRMNDAALVESGGVFRILPRSEAGLSAPVVGFRTVTARGLTVRVTPLRFVTVDDISEVLDGFAPVAGSIRYDRQRNLVFTTGTQAEQNTVMSVISTLDVNYFAGRSFALQPLDDASPQPIIAELEQLFARPDGRPNPAIRFLAIERIGAVLIVTERDELLNEAIQLTKFLDQGAGETPTLHVFTVQNRRAADLAVILGDLFNTSVSSVEPTSPIANSLAPQTATGSDGISGADLGLDGDEAGISRAEIAAASEAPLASSPAPFQSGAETAATPRSGVLRIVADESSNAIVALATAEGAEELASAMRRLDVQPLQVMIEATLLSVDLNDQLEFGVRWFLQSGNFSSGFTDPPSTVSLPGVLGFFPGFNAAFNTADINVTVNALDAVTNVRILSSPTLMVLDNQTARLQVGDQVPITVRSSQSVSDPDAPLVTETEFRDTGVILEVQPTVNAGGLVVLGIRQEVSEVQPTVGEENPTFSQRTVESTIAVQSGDTIALAGLIEESSTNEKAGIPYLSDIPLLGNAFGTRSNDAGRSELIVLIRPVVIRNQNEAREATDELRRKLQNLVTDEDLEQLTTRADVNRALANQ